jgi:hypothetical protein
MVSGVIVWGLMVFHDVPVELTACVSCAADGVGGACARVCCARVASCATSGAECRFTAAVLLL